ncbi:MAG: hypothetical protein IJT32_00500 [Lachnospiraceae bacterium]|nr:hypothetical protein [Lachnospiraceae bacterium]
MQSDHIIISNVDEQFVAAQAITDAYLAKTGISGKNALRLNLLMEEALRLVKEIVAERSVEIWLEGDAMVSRIYVTADMDVDAVTKEKMLSISSKGSNEAGKEGFFDRLVGVFSGRNTKEPSWSLLDYKAQIMAKRKEDPYAKEAWDDLERSVLAKLADDIAVGIEEYRVWMIITKNLSETMSTVGSRTPKVVSEQILLDQREERIANALNRADGCIGSLSIEDKKAGSLKLAFEEVLGMLRQITGGFDAIVWFERYEMECCMKLIAKTKMSVEKKSDLLSVSSTGKNASVNGFMAKVADVIETSLLDYDESGSRGHGKGLARAAGKGAAVRSDWALSHYRDELAEIMDDDDEAQAAWENLEKSIVASIAKDVIVGVKKNRVDITLIMDL